MKSNQEEKTFLLEILTPEGKAFSDKIISLQLETPDGKVGVEAHHAPYIAVVKKGILMLKKNDNKSLKATLDNGFLQVKGDNQAAIILTSSFQTL